MRYQALIACLTILTIFSVSMPAALLIAPPPQAHAQLVVSDITNLPQSIITAVQSTLQVAAKYASYALEYLYYVNTYVLEPLAFIQSGQASQALTGGMLAFVSGQSNGTGQSQFVQNIPGHFQSVGDNTAQAFFRQMERNSNSPYGGVIVSSLRTNYLQQSSLAGFFAANRSTLPQYSSDPQAFLRGDWSKGGLNAWFAVSTQSQNNPYILHQRTQRQLGVLLAGAREKEDKVLNWGKGFLSWCGAEEGATLEEGAVCDAGGYKGTWSSGICIQDEASDTPTADVSPGAPCSKEDGTPGKIQTPGSTITSFFEKTLGLNADKINSMGNAASQITSLVGSLMQTIQLAQTVISGPQGGLAGVGSAGQGQTSSLLDQYSSATSTYAGLNQCVINNTLAKNAPSNGSEVTQRIPEYLDLWETIGAAAAAASTAVTTLRDTCLANAQSPSASAAFASRATSIAAQATAALDKGQPDGIVFVLTKAQNASSTVDATVAKIAEVTTALNSTGPVCPNLTTEAQSLNNLTPTAQDLAYAKQDAMTTTAASTTPPGSLTLVSSEGTLVTKMNLLAQNAAKLLPQCALP